MSDKIVPNSFIRESLINLINNKKISTEILYQVTKINKDWLNTYLTDSDNVPGLSPYDCTYLSELAMFLSQDFSAQSQDERLLAVIDILFQVYKLNSHILSNYSGVPENEINNFIEDSSSITTDTKYKLSILTMLLYYIFKYPDYNKINNTHG